MATTPTPINPNQAQAAKPKSDAERAAEQAAKDAVEQSNDLLESDDDDEDDDDTDDTESTSASTTPATKAGSAPDNEESLPAKRVRLEAEKRQVQKDIDSGEAAVAAIQTMAPAARKTLEEVMKNNIATLKKQIATIDGELGRVAKLEKLQGISEPLVKALGTLTIENAKLLPASVHINDVEADLKKATESAHTAIAKVAMLKHIHAAVVAGKFAEKIDDDFPALQVKPADDGKSVTFAFSTRGSGGRKAGTGAPRGSSKVSKILTVGAKGEARGLKYLEGRLIGSAEGAAFASFNALYMEHATPEEHAALDHQSRNMREWFQRIAEATTEVVE